MATATPLLTKTGSSDWRKGAEEPNVALLASAAGVCLVAFLGFGRNLEIAFTTGVLWSAVSDSPHDHAEGWRGHGLWVHVAGLAIWILAALYQILWSGPRKRANLLKTLPKAEDAKEDASEVTTSSSEEACEAAASLEEACQGAEGGGGEASAGAFWLRCRCQRRRVARDSGGAVPVRRVPKLALAAAPAPAPRAASTPGWGAPAPPPPTAATLAQDAAKASSSSSPAFSPHNIVGQFVAAPALFIGCFAGAFWWQIQNGAPATSPVFWYTQGLFACSFGQVVLGIRRAKASAATRRRLADASDAVRHAERDSNTATSAKLKLYAARQRNHLDLHQIYIFLGCVWASDPGLHRVMFWGRILTVWFEPTRQLFYEPGTSFEEARDDRLAQAAILTLGKAPVNLALFLLVGLAIVRRKREVRERRERQSTMDVADGDNSHFVLFLNLFLLSFWFFSITLLVFCGTLLPAVSIFQRAVTAGMWAVYIGTWRQLGLRGILKEGFVS